jgi:hypothetical protein
MNFALIKLIDVDPSLGNGITTFCFLRLGISSYYIFYKLNLCLHVYLHRLVSAVGLTIL